MRSKLKLKLFNFLLLFFSVSYVFNADIKDSEFCWKDSYFRNIGTIPKKCPEDREKIGLFCYSKCPIGYERFGFDCHQICPSGSEWKDQGLFCRLVEYGRGAGYIGLDNCENKQGVGNCEKNLTSLLSEM